MFTFFTELIRQDVVDRHGRFVGKPYDFAAHLDESYPSLKALIIGKGLIKRRYYVVPWSNVHHTGDQFQLKVTLESLSGQLSYRDKVDITLRKNILDQQVVDTFNRKVVRVNDLHFLKVNGEIRIAHVDIGLRGLVRRIGWERLIDLPVRMFNRHSRYLVSDKFIPWKYIQPISIQPLTGNIHLKIDQEQLHSIPPPDLSEMLMELDANQRAAIFKTLDFQHQIDILTEFELKWQVDLIEELDPRITANLLEKMPADEATDLVGALPRADADRFLSMLSPKKSRELTELLKYEVHSAGGLMTKEYVSLKENITVKEALDYICQTELKKAETIHTSYIVNEDNHLIGVVLLRKLLNALPGTKIADVMLKKPPALRLEDDLKEVATMLSKYNLFAAPVVNDEGAMEGIITIDDVLEVIIEEKWGGLA